MKLGIIGTGAMGRVLHACAKEDGAFEEIVDIEPTRPQSWPAERMDLLIDFSHPDAIQAIYEYCRAQGGHIPVVLATTGYGREAETVIGLLRKICPVDRRSNYSRGVAAMENLCRQAAASAGGCDVRIVETHHTKKRDAPSGTAKMLQAAVLQGLGGAAAGDGKARVPITSLRMGTVFGEHTVYFAMEDEVLEIRHTALSKRIFAMGALAAGKRLLAELGDEPAPEETGKGWPWHPQCL